MSSLLPLLLDLADELDGSYHRKSKFGLGIDPEDLFYSTPRLSRSYIMPYNTRRQGIQCNRRRNRGIVKKTSNKKEDSQIVGKDAFQVCMDVQEFAPNEITVKTVDNNIVVEAKHEEREDDHGYISRQFTRRYTLPEGYNIKDVVSKLSSDGILTVQAPPIERTEDGSKVRVIQIQQTGPAIENVSKENPSSQETK